MEREPGKEHITTPHSPTKWLSHSFDIYQSGAPAYTKPQQKINLLEDAIAELTNLDGGKEAWKDVLEQFESEHGRALGDEDAARSLFLKENPGSERYVNSDSFSTDQILSDKHWLAYRLAETITETRDPRTPEYLEQYYVAHRPFEDAFYEEHEFIQFQTLLDTIPEDLKEVVRTLKDENERLATLTEQLYEKNRQLKKDLEHC